MPREPRNIELFVEDKDKMESVVTRMKVDDSGGRSKNKELLLNDLYIDPIGYQVKIGQKEIDLTVKELNLLYLFARHVGKVVKRSEILQVISTPNMSDQERSINIIICRLRKKLEVNPHRPRLLVSVKGLGYRLKEQKPM